MMAMVMLRNMMNHEVIHLNAQIAERDAEIKRLKALLTQAADALDIELDLSSPVHHIALIIELRKAAQ